MKLLNDAIIYNVFNLNIMQKRIFGVCLALLAMLVASCGTTKTPQDIQMDKALYAQAAQAIKNGDFVLESDQLQFKRGNIANVMNNTNFISMRNNTVTVQTAFNNGFQGANNLGGVTLEGSPRNIKVSTDKKGNLNYQMDVMGAILSARVELTLYAESNRAVATVFPNFSSNQLTLRGNIFPTEESNVFKGRTF